ncbi:nucleoside phosphorylase domain-containing protein [Aspergillus crustosus]
MRPEPHEFELAIICALPREFDAVIALLDERYNSISTARTYGDANYYQTGRTGVRNVVVVRLLDMGNAPAAGAAASLRSSFPNISLTLVIEICGGVPFPTADNGLVLDDVIISHQVVKHGVGRQYPDGFERRGPAKETLDRSNAAVISILAGLPTRDLRDRLRCLHVRYLRALQKDPTWAYPGVDKDRLFRPSCEHNAAADHGSATDCDSVGCAGTLVARKRLSNGTNPPPWVHLGAIASGDAVMKSASHRDRLARDEDIIGFEMEGAGVCEILSSLTIKGVCDYADSHKHKDWQDYAAACGASCAMALLECLTQTTYQHWNLSIYADFNPKQLF